ncbi:hypothetical protein CLIM01_14294 [Colletotrichum limetticola]|uniref:Uncharacterized protein n=1 Tax=Colletotrichum limetticola TaxID=1209924 RepID=A0ABQ9P8X0_9PEZI|nr:hypothetical protein CLIM01_14294 [Colletotrichum limetticola]
MTSEEVKVQELLNQFKDLFEEQHPAAIKAPAGFDKALQKLGQLKFSSEFYEKSFDYWFAYVILTCRDDNFDVSLQNLSASSLQQLLSGVV